MQSCSPRITASITVHLVSSAHRRRCKTTQQVQPVGMRQTHLRAVRQQTGWLQPARQQRHLVLRLLLPQAQVLGPSAPLEQLQQKAMIGRVAVTPGAGICLPPGKPVCTTDSGVQIKQRGMRRHISLNMYVYRQATPFCDGSISCQDLLRCAAPPWRARPRFGGPECRS